MRYTGTLTAVRDTEASRRFRPRKPRASGKRWPDEA